MGRHRGHEQAAACQFQKIEQMAARLLCVLTSFDFYRQGTCCTCALYSLLDHWPKLRPCCACFSPAIFLCARPSRTRAPPLQGEHCLVSAALSGVQGHRQLQAPSAERTKHDGGSEVGRAETLLVQHWCECACACVCNSVYV